MSYDEKTAERVRRILSRRKGVVEKRMFGGLCFMLNGSMVCGLTSTAFMVRVGPERYEETLALPHVRPMDFTGRPLKGMVYVGPGGYGADADLVAWVKRGIDYVAMLPAKKVREGKKRAGARQGA